MAIGHGLGVHRGQVDGGVARVEHHEIVAQAVHFHKGGHGGVIGMEAALFHGLGSLKFPSWRDKLAEPPCAFFSP
jgi:hypothetical protein